MSDAIARASRTALAFSSSVMTFTRLPAPALLLHQREVPLGHTERVQAQLAGDAHQEAAEVHRGWKGVVAVRLDVLEVAGGDPGAVGEHLERHPARLPHVAEQLAVEDRVGAELEGPGPGLAGPLRHLRL